MLYHIFHSTQFSYQQWVSFSHNLIRLRPRNTPTQTLVDYSLSTDPIVSEMESYDDYFGNHLCHLLIREPHHHLKVTARSCVAIDYEAVEHHAKLAHEARRVTYTEMLDAFHANTPDVIDALQYRLPSRYIPLANHDLREYVLLSFAPDKSLYGCVEAFMNRVFNDFQFVSGFSDLSTPVEEVFRERKGVCQDFAHLSITALRSIGLSVRYMSGYLETLPLEGEEKFFGADASHAWFSVFIPNFGWFDFDPTNNIIPSYQHIVLGYGRDYDDCSPMQGVVQGSGLSRLNVMVDVSRDDSLPI
ncbi:MAG: transglutaminase family protein [Sulfuricurvum sp.]|uniref:transglutaminase family protein n=1 Tax=Sulfuricurvum sp. TaxID=2025608 RepID=UPI002618129E|nr:transglutaminase family protein [Sulfuricurvum sp.]MDD2829436.1 transglutaminase family protein [Sulfuricurvum sp.]MDD4948481.1 transglutaminase family protein [Sulfuricurvum sp.]